VNVVCTLPAPVPRAEFAARVDQLMGGQALAFAYGPEQVRTVAVLSGKGDHDLEGAFQAGADAYITGEAGVSTREHAREAGITFFAAGHHATERFGVQALGARLVERFGVEHAFVEVENPV